MQSPRNLGWDRNVRESLEKLTWAPQNLGRYGGLLLAAASPKGRLEMSWALKTWWIQEVKFPCGLWHLADAWVILMGPHPGGPPTGAKHSQGCAFPSRVWACVVRCWQRLCPLPQKLTEAESPSLEVSENAQKSHQLNAYLDRGFLTTTGKIQSVSG